MSDILQRIIADKQPEIESLHEGKDFDRYMEEAASSPRIRSFHSALVRPDRVAVIAEIKKASPSKGIFREDFVPSEIALAYSKGGASAISVLTEHRYFQGNRSDLQTVRDAVDLPLLRKDFIIDPFQIPESRLLGADSVLLIAAVLSDMEINSLLGLARQLRLAALCEVHDETEMKRVIDCGADLIGINNRDLKTFEVSLQTTFDLAPLAPENAVLVSESGITCYADLEILRDIGVAAVLVGEALIRQKDVRQALRNLFDRDTPSPSMESIS